MKASHRKSHRRSRAVSGAPICTACRTAPWFFLPEFSERLSPRRSAPAVPAFVFPPPLQKVACTPLPAFWVRCTSITRWAGVVSAPTLLLLFDLLQQVVSTPLPGSLGCGVPAPDDPFCLYLNLCGCKALPAVWVRLKAAATCLCLSLKAFSFRNTPQPARESRIGAPELYRERRSDLTGRPRVLQTFRLHGFCFWEPLGADGRSARKVVRRDQTGRVDLGARRHNACYV